MSEHDPVTIRAIIGNLPSWYADLGRLIAPGNNGRNGERVSTSKVEASSPINENAVDLRRDIIDTLDKWTRKLLDDVLFGAMRPSRSPAFTAGVLLMLWPWLLCSEWYEVMAAELVDLAKRADNLTDPPERRKVADRIHDGLIDGRDAATVLSVSASSIRAWVAAGDLAVAERGANGRNLYRIDDIRLLKLRRDNARGIHGAELCPT